MTTEKVLQEVPRLRRTKEAWLYILQQDPETSLTHTAIQEMILRGVIPSHVNGDRRKFVDLNVLLAFLAGDVKGPVPSYVPRLRTIRKAHNYIRQRDPQTAISEQLLRDLVRRGTLRYVEVGSKYLIDLDEVLDYFSKTESRPDDFEFNRIRKIY